MMSSSVLRLCSTGAGALLSRQRHVLSENLTHHASVVLLKRHFGESTAAARPRRPAGAADEARRLHLRVDVDDFHHFVDERYGVSTDRPEFRPGSISVFGDGPACSFGPRTEQTTKPASFSKTAQSENSIDRTVTTGGGRGTPAAVSSALPDVVRKSLLIDERYLHPLTDNDTHPAGGLKNDHVDGRREGSDGERRVLAFCRGRTEEERRMARLFAVFLEEAGG